MTGWRCGWAIGPSKVIAACNALQSHATSNVCSITQKAVTAALSGPQECVGEMLAEYRHRRDQLCAWLAKEPRFRFVTPAGAFYLFIDVSAFLSPEGIRTSAELATVTPERRSSGGHAGRGVRRARLPAAVVRDVARRAGTRHRKDHRLPARDGKPDERRRRLGRACSIPAFSRSSKRPSVLPTSVRTTPVDRSTVLTR